MTKIWESSDIRIHLEYSRRSDILYRISFLRTNILLSQANLDYPSVKLFIYMDSDAVIDINFESTSLNNMMKIMQDKLDWDPMLKPMVFNQVYHL